MSTCEIGDWAAVEYFQLRRNIKAYFIAAEFRDVDKLVLGSEETFIKLGKVVAERTKELVEKLRLANLRSKSLDRVVGEGVEKEMRQAEEIVRYREALEKINKKVSCEPVHTLMISIRDMAQDALKQEEVKYIPDSTGMNDYYKNCNTHGDRY